MKLRQQLLYTLLGMGSLLSCHPASSPLRSNNKEVEATLFIRKGMPYYSVTYQGDTVIYPSRLGLMADGNMPGDSASVRLIEKRTIHETYSTRGFHTEAVNQATEYTYQITSSHPRKGFLWQVRLYDDGLAFRYKFQTSDSITIRQELTEFTPPAHAPVWFFERTDGDWKLKSYAGIWTRSRADSLHSISPSGPVQGVPLVYELPGNRYMVLTESALYAYSGMRLEARQDASLCVNLTEQPQGFRVRGESVTPWRVILLAKDLNQMVNSDLVTNLNPCPDSLLYKDPSYIRPGRSVWSWWSDPPGYMTLPLEKHFIDRAHELGFEYTLLDEGWEALPRKWDTLKEICDYARHQDVRVFVWKHSNQLNDPAGNYRSMALFLDSVKAAGAAGIKIDFMNGETKQLIDFDTKALQLCAERRLMVNFHGCQQPSGEYRTYPNEITREGIRGLELNRMNRPLTGNHNVALVFTRCLLNNADYTPMGFSRPGETTWAHQLATAYAFTSPLTVMAEHPDTIFLNPKIAPMLPLIKSLPTTWDETRVLPESSIEKRAILARRKGKEWFWIALNGREETSLRVKTDFLSSGEWQADGITDTPHAPHAVNKFKQKTKAGDTFPITLKANGGAVIHFTPKP